MENEIKNENNKEENVNKGMKKLKSKKSVNWESNIQKEEENKKKKEGKISSKENPKEFLEIEVINKDGNIVKENVKYEHKTSKEFSKKREEYAHNEYTKAKEFFVKHKNDEE